MTAIARFARRRAVALGAVIVLVMSACQGAGDASTSGQQRTRSAGTLDQPPPVSLPHRGPSATSPNRSRSYGAATSPSGTRTGFRTRAQMDRHFEKHGAEFGHLTESEYVRRAQALRDAPLGGAVEELTRPDGTISRFDRASGAFIAFDADGTILTFFRPNTGESYFRRQATHAH